MLWTPRKGKAAMFTAVAVDTAVLGDVHAGGEVTGVTELIGVPDSTSYLVSENAHVVTCGAPPPQAPTTQMGRYQAVPSKAPPVVGAVKVAVSVVTTVAFTSQNMNCQYDAGAVGVASSYWYSAPQRDRGATRERTAPERPPGSVAPDANSYELKMSVAGNGPACATAGTNMDRAAPATAARASLARARRLNAPGASYGDRPGADRNCHGGFGAGRLRC